MTRGLWFLTTEVLNDYFFPWSCTWTLVNSFIHVVVCVVFYYCKHLCDSHCHRSWTHKHGPCTGWQQARKPLCKQTDTLHTEKIHSTTLNVQPKSSQLYIYGLLNLYRIWNSTGWLVMRFDLIWGEFFFPGIAGNRAQSFFLVACSSPAPPSFFSSSSDSLVSSSSPSPPSSSSFASSDSSLAAWT